MASAKAPARHLSDSERSSDAREASKAAQMDDSTEGLMNHLPYGELLGSGVVGFLTGFLGSMAGVGGGPFCVPLLAWLLGLGHKRCVGTSILCGLTTLTVGGITAFLSSGPLNISLVPISVLAAVAPAFGYVSAKMSNNISPLILKQIFAVFLLVTSLQIVWGLAYSPTGVEGHWQYDLRGRTHVYEIEASEGHLYFRTQNFGGVLRPVREARRDNTLPEVDGMPTHYDDGWFTIVSLLDGPQREAAPNNATRGMMWVRVAESGQSMETLYHAFNAEHWNAPVTAVRKKSWHAEAIASAVSTLFGNVCFHLVIAVTAGCASGLLGIAGGSVVVPLMSLSGAFPWQVITTTSLLSMIPTSCTTCYTHYLNGNVALQLAPGLVGGTIFGAFAGSKLMAITSEVVRRSACAGVLLLTASIMLYQGTKHLFTSTQKSKPSLLKLGAAAIFFYSLAALIQEKVFNLPEFSHEYLLAFLQNVVVCALSFYDLSKVKAASPAPESVPENERVGVYAGIAVLATIGGICTNRASRMLNHTTQVAVRSTKLGWIMLFRALFLPWCRKPVLQEWGYAVLLSLGVFVFSTAGSHVHTETEGAFWEGIAAIVTALVCDITMFTVEEGVVFSKFGADKHELLMYTSGLSVPASFFFLLRSGSFSAGWLYLQMEWRFPTLTVAYAFCNYIGTKYVLQIIQDYDSSMAVLCTTLRKVVTVILSFMLFPKAITASHLIGLGLALVCSYQQVQHAERYSEVSATVVRKELDVEDFADVRSASHASHADHQKLSSTSPRV